ncbi:hypothetical protein V8D89_009739 [Ganoderma adspersum]
MFTPKATWTGFLDTSLSTHSGVGGIHSPIVLPTLHKVSAAPSICRRRGGRANAFPIQSPVGDGRLGLCGVGASHCKAEPPTACTGTNAVNLAKAGARGGGIFHFQCVQPETPRGVP